MPEILLLCEYATLNGGERSMLATLDGVRQAGFTPVVMAPSEGPLVDVLISRGIERLPFECSTADGTRLPQNRLREYLSSALAWRRPAMLHANSLAMGRLSGPVVAELKLPSLSHLRDIIRLSAQAVADLNHHTRLLAVSNATREFHVSRGMTAEKVYTVYNGVDLEQFQPRSPTGYLHGELGLPPEIRLIGTIGQIGLRKGQDVLLRAAARIADQWPNAHYAIIGERHSEKDESRQFEHGLHEALHGPLTGRVHFLGVRGDVGRLLNEFTLLVHPPRQEPLGRVLLEAAASGVAIIATDVGGTREIFPPEQEAARLVSPDDADAMADAMSELLGDLSQQRRMARAARRRAEGQFDVRRTVNELLNHYRAIVG